MGTALYFFWFPDKPVFFDIKAVLGLSGRSPQSLSHISLMKVSESQIGVSRSSSQGITDDSVQGIK